MKQEFLSGPGLVNKIFCSKGMGAMKNIVLNLDEAEAVRKKLVQETNRLVGYAIQVSRVGGGSWWDDDNGASFRSSLASWESDFRSWLGETETLYMRARREFEEWGETDMRFKYSEQPNFIEMVQDAFSGKKTFMENFNLKNWKEMSFKFSVKDFISPVLPFDLRYPPEKETKYYQDASGKWYKEEYTGGSWDAGVGFGFDKNGKFSAGPYLKGNSWKKEYISALLIPGMIGGVTFTGPSYEVTGTGASASLIGADFDAGWNVDWPIIGEKFVGLNIGVDVGWGFGFSDGAAKIGPFSFGLSLGDPKDPTPPPAAPD